MKDKSTWYSGRVPTNTSVYAEHMSLLSQSLRMTQCIWGPFLNYLNTLVVPMVNSALRAKTERKERRRTKVYCACEVLGLKSKGSECVQASAWSGCRKLALWLPTGQSGWPYPRAQLSSTSTRNYPGELGYWAQEGWEHARTISHTPCLKTGVEE